MMVKDQHRTESSFNSAYKQVEGSMAEKSPYSLLGFSLKGGNADPEDSCRSKIGHKKISSSDVINEKGDESSIRWRRKQSKAWFNFSVCNGLESCVLHKEKDPMAEDKDMKMYNLMFLLVACGYMSSWTAIGSLIPYFRSHYGADFYVKIYCAYYLPGLFVSLLQQRYDDVVDRWLGSWKAYMIRMCASFMLVIVLLVSLPFLPDIPDLRIFVMGIIGSFSWLMHGTACMLVSMFPPASTAWLQTGFRCPEIFTVVIVIMLDLEENPSKESLITFHFATAGLLVLGALSFVAIMNGPPAQHYLRAKDHVEKTSDMEIIPLVQKKLESFDGTIKHLEPVEGKEIIADAIVECRLALFVTIFASVFTAAFFAYVNSTDGNDIEQILYFTRLFCDLFGRPITRLPRPKFMGTPSGLMWSAIARGALAVVFFLYISVPGFPQNDTFVTFLIGIFSVGSGYISVLAYETAALQVKSKSAQTYAATLMNTSFQYAAFTSVVCGVIVADMGML